jgi:hypothetical protein
MKARSTRATSASARGAYVTVTAQLALLAGAMTAACSANTGTLPDGNTQGSQQQGPGTGTGEDAGAPPSTGSGETASDSGSSAASTDAGASTATDAASTAPDSSAPPDAAPTVACGSMSSINAIVSQFGSDNTASTVTPMGARFETAAQAGPISAANLAFLATASSNPTVSEATSASGLSWQTVNVTLYPSGSPSPEDIMQHAIGDCDGDSAMASMAYVNPAFVSSLIKDNGDGTYNIAMFDPMGVPITIVVDSEVLVDTSDPNLGAVSANDGSADWATILEKAVMKYDYAYNVVGQLDGIGSEELIPMFTGTGESFAISPGSLTSAQFQQVVTVSLAAGQFITGGFNQELDLGADSTVTAHGYAVMIPTVPTVDMADMRNPWGVNPWASTSSNSGYDTSTDGLLEIPLSSTPTEWTQIIDLRIISPGAQCAGVTTPFAPQLKKASGMATPIHIREPHARHARGTR